MTRDRRYLRVLEHGPRRAIAYIGDDGCWHLDLFTAGDWVRSVVRGGLRAMEDTNVEACSFVNAG